MSMFSLLLLLAIPDHSLFDALLKAHLHKERVDYAAIKKDPRFPHYLAELEACHPETLPNRNEKMAFWINAYNAFTIRGVLRHWPKIKSVKDPYPEFGFFRQMDLEIGGKRYSLEQIEDQILRPRFRDPRIHAALNSASVSSPPLAPWAFQASKLSRQLSERMKAFILDPKRNRLGQEALLLSPLFDWYAKDFQAAGGVRAYLSRFLKGDLKEQVLSAERLGFMPYDWSLNRLR